MLKFLLIGEAISEIEREHIVGSADRNAGKPPVWGRLICLPLLPALLHPDTCHASWQQSVCLTWPLGCELRDAELWVTHQQVSLAHPQRLMDEQTSVSLALDRTCGCQRVLCMFHLPFLQLSVPSLELLPLPCPRYRNIPRRV